ncbi:MAG: cobalt ECF transporter T component CbiQ [Methanomassiliicoccales archaeon]
MAHDEIDRYAKRSRYFRFDPRVKLACVIAFIVVIAFLRSLEALALCTLFAIILAEVSGVPLRHLGENLVLASPFILFAFLTMWYSSGLPNAVGLMLRISASVLALVVLIASTPFFDTIRAFRWFRMPRLLATLILFTYRFIFVLLDEISRMRMARKARGFAGGTSLLDKVAFRTISNTIGMIFVRSQSRASTMFDALLSRGYDGEVRTLTRLKAQARDVAFALPFVLVCALAILLQLEVKLWTLWT